MYYFLWLLNGLTPMNIYYLSKVIVFSTSDSKILVVKVEEKTFWKGKIKTEISMEKG